MMQDLVCLRKWRLERHIIVHVTDKTIKFIGLLLFFNIVMACAFRVSAKARTQ